KATFSDDLLLPLDRHGYREECYLTLSFSPIRDEAGRVHGVFTTAAETTRRVLGERRLRTLRDLALRAAEARTTEQACESAVRTLAANPGDIPFALLYLLAADGERAHLAGGTGRRVRIPGARHQPPSGPRRRLPGFSRPGRRAPRAHHRGRARRGGRAPASRRAGRARAAA